MAMRLSQADLRRAAERAHSLQARLQNMKKQTERVTERVVQSVEVGAAAFVAGILRGKVMTDGKEGYHPFGIPLDLGLGVALNLGGYLGFAGDKMSSHLNGFGDGFLAAYMVSLGRETGQKWGVPAATSGPTAGGGTGRLESGVGGTFGSMSAADAAMADAIAKAIRQPQP